MSQEGNGKKPHSVEGLAPELLMLDEWVGSEVAVSVYGSTLEGEAHDVMGMRGTLDYMDIGPVEDPTQLVGSYRVDSVYLDLGVPFDVEVRDDPALGRELVFSIGENTWVEIHRTTDDTGPESPQEAA